MKKFQSIINSYINEQNLNIPTQILKNTNIAPTNATKDTANVLDTLSNVLNGTKTTPQKPEEVIKAIMTALQLQDPKELDPLLASIGYPKQNLQSQETTETNSEDITKNQSNPPKSTQDSYITSAPKA